jgi:hypothetical protein
MIFFVFVYFRIPDFAVKAEKGGMMERFLDIHMYITAAHQKTDMRAVGLQLAMDLLYEKVNFYLNISGKTIPAIFM